MGWSIRQSGEGEGVWWCRLSLGVEPMCGGQRVGGGSDRRRDESVRGGGWGEGGRGRGWSWGSRRVWWELERCVGWWSRWEGWRWGGHGGYLPCWWWSGG